MGVFILKEQLGFVPDVHAVKSRVREGRFRFIMVYFEVLYSSRRKWREKGDRHHLLFFLLQLQPNELLVGVPRGS
jgi:hypothetical protein